MPTQRDDLDTQWDLTVPDSKYTLAKQATITVSIGYGIQEASSNNEIVVLGDIIANGAASGAIRFASAASTLSIGADSRIDARQISYAIIADGGGQEIVNHGQIQADTAGIQGFNWGKVENFGTIEAFIGIHYAAAGSEIVNHGRISGTYGVLTKANSTVVINQQGGEITGDYTGISLEGDGFATIINRGTISGGDYAVEGGTEQMKFVNRGRIVGDVLLSAENDLFDTRKGDVKGTIYGGGGDDIYVITRANVRIDDRGASFDDRVASSVTYTLNGGLDHLTLFGNKNVDATGNSGANVLFGNNGDNVLWGKDGLDDLHGGRGDDVLIGGSGADTFNFLAGHGVDTIEDFEDGIDKLYSVYVGNPDRFDDIDIKSVRGDLVLNFADGDRLILRNTEKSAITFDDFGLI